MKPRKTLLSAGKSPLSWGNFCSRKSHTELQAEKHRITGGSIDEAALKERITAAVEALEIAPATKQRAIFNNVIQFAELHPKKVRLGVYAPLITLARSTSVQNGGGRETRGMGPRKSLTLNIK